MPRPDHPCSDAADVGRPRRTYRAPKRAKLPDADGLARTAPAMMLQPPATLSKVVPAADYERFRKQLARYGATTEQAEPLKPFMASV